MARPGAWVPIGFDSKVLTVEHLLPQTLRRGSEGLGVFEYRQKQHWTHRIANLLLRDLAKNMSSNNYAFATKEQRYFTARAGTSPLFTTQVLQHEQWTPIVLYERQQMLIGRSASEWGMR